MRRLPILLPLLAAGLAGGAAAAGPQDGAQAGTGLVARIETGIAVLPRVWRQFRVEGHISIRIIPGNGTMPPAMITELEEERMDGVEEKKIGKCLGIASIVAVRAGDANQLLLFLHDQRIVTASLEKHCSARDFYSGFYVRPQADGAICVGRDSLQSRSGANCKLRRLTELVPDGERRFP